MKAIHVVRQEPSEGNADTKSVPLKRSGEGSKLGSFKPAIPGAVVLDVHGADVLDVHGAPREIIEG